MGFKERINQGETLKMKELQEIRSSLQGLQNQYDLKQNEV